MTALQRLLPYSLVILLSLTIAACFAKSGVGHNPDALRQIVDEQCLPHQEQQQSPEPCAKVDIAQGYAILKDRNGPLQYLLIPTSKISGIESPELLSQLGQAFMAQAWQERVWMSRKAGKPVPDDIISLTINAQRARTQNQLHIHISCLKPEIRTELDSMAQILTPQWRPIRNSLQQHVVWAKRISLAELQHDNPFSSLAQGPAQQHMGAFGLGLATLPGGDFALLASQQTGPFPHPSMEIIQGHACPQVMTAVSHN